MARERYDDREYERDDGSLRRERPWGYDDPYAGRSRSLAGDYGRENRGRGRFGERAEYDYDEPRYTNYSETREENYGRPSRESYREYPSRRLDRYDQRSRSRIRSRDIMTRELAVATRESSLYEVALMMKDEDTGVIPVVDYQISSAEGKNTVDTPRETRGNGKLHYGKLVGLITDRDIVMRAVAENKDCAATRAEEIMTTDIYSARPNDRVVDIIRKMGDKQVRRIPVVGENGFLRGMISMSDIALETEADRELAEALEDISKESSFWNRLFS
jgi:CBS domain-containing protein